MGMQWRACVPLRASLVGRLWFQPATLEFGVIGHLSLNLELELLNRTLNFTDFTELLTRIL